jgi:hypothetical protein
MKESPLFISQLLALAKTMSKVDEDSFNMFTYYRGSSINTCGYVACVCSHQAVSRDLKLFPKSDTALSLGTLKGIYLANYIDEDIREACIVHTGSSYLAKSVTSSCDRKLFAHSSNLLTPNQLEHPHLNSESSPKLAARYIRMLVKVLTNE